MKYVGTIFITRQERACNVCIYIINSLSLCAIEGSNIPIVSVVVLNYNIMINLRYGTVGATVGGLRSIRVLYFI